MHRWKLFSLAATAMVLITEPTLAQGPPAAGRGFGRGRQMHRGGGPPHDARHQADRQVFQFLLANHDKIKRTVENLPNGVVTVTESDDPVVADHIKEHVQWMEHRLENINPIRMRDPLFAELFKHTEKIKLEHEETEQGVKVTETSADPYVATLIQAHATVVSGFVERGFAEAMKQHAVPAQNARRAADRASRRLTPTQLINPVIKDHGSVVPLPDAAQQPVSGSKLVVDLTAGESPEKLNPAVEKLARYVNLYAGGGAEPASVHMTVVFHGNATLSVLNDDAYAKTFGTDSNPNLELLHQLHEAGVELLVCGQSLVGKGAQSEDVVVFVDVAVSALTALVNHQSDGYAYIPLQD